MRLQMRAFAVGRIEEQGSRRSRAAEWPLVADIGPQPTGLVRDRPTAASWLTPEEKEWLTTELAQERRELEAVRTYTLFQSLTNIRVLALAVIYFGIVTASVGLVLFVPQIIKQLGALVA
jgi:hypothetical protein